MNDLLQAARDKLVCALPALPVETTSFDIHRGFRLHALREKFEAAAKEYEGPFDDKPQYDWQLADVEAWLRFAARAQSIGHLRNKLAMATFEAGCHYVAARDFNEFDRKRALMLWKLQNGGAM